MKLLGAHLFVIGGFVAVAGNPYFFLLAAIGLLCFLQGMENAIVAQTTDFVRRAIRENKTYEELLKDKDADTASKAKGDPCSG